MGRSILADGIYYHDYKGHLVQETWTETLAHERIDELTARLGRLEKNVFEMPIVAEPHTCEECKHPFYRSDYGLCRSHPVVKKSCQPIAIWREHEACENFKGEA